MMGGKIPGMKGMSPLKGQLGAAAGLLKANSDLKGKDRTGTNFAKAGIDGFTGIKGSGDMAAGLDKALTGGKGSEMLNKAAAPLISAADKTGATQALGEATKPATDALGGLGIM